jgi:hypothetical protein
MGAKNHRSSLLTLRDEAIILAYRWRTRLSLDDLHVRLRCLMPELSRSALYRCLKRRGLSKIGPTARCRPMKSAGVAGAYVFEITATEVALPSGLFGSAYHVFLAVEENTKQVYAQVANPTPENAAAFLTHLVAESPPKILTVKTDISPTFADRRTTLDQDMAGFSPHPFTVVCRANRINQGRMIPGYPIPLRPKKGARAVEFRMAGQGHWTTTR